jgi:serine/threonine-protein kinase
MNENQTPTPPEEEEERTVFTPPPAPAPEDRTVIAPGLPEEPAEEERTTISPVQAAPPAGNAAPAEDRTVISPAPAQAMQPGMTMQPGMIPGQTNMTFSNFAPRTDGQRIQVGDVLNHIYRVDRFLARGGMGEVFEGVNVNTDERVAIKVMLPALAADEKVVSMFRKEAKTMIRLHHEALVGYRVLAQEPQLGVLYIVSEFIDGVNLSTRSARSSRARTSWRAC